MNADIIIIGGGAAGAMAGVYCGEWGKKTIIFEPNGKIGKKLSTVADILSLSLSRERCRNRSLRARKLL